MGPKAAANNTFCRTQPTLSTLCSRRRLWGWSWHHADNDDIFAGDDDAPVRDDNVWDDKEEMKVISTAGMSMKAEFYVWKGENSFNHSNRSKLLTLHAERHIIKVGHSSSNETQDSFLQILKLHHDHRPKVDTSLNGVQPQSFLLLIWLPLSTNYIDFFFTQFRCVDSQIRIIDWNWILTQWQASLHATLWELLSSNIKHRFIKPAHEARGPEGPARWER